MEAAAGTLRGADARPAAVLGMITDMTDQKQAEDERERLVLNLGERVKELGLLHEAARLLHHASGADQLLLAELAVRMPAAWLHADDACARVAYGELSATSPDWRETPWMQTATFTTRRGTGVLQVAYRSEHPPADEGPFLAEERALIDSLADMLQSHIDRGVMERERQAVEAQLRQAQKMEALGTLAGGIAHDFNNLLTAIGANAQLAALDVEPGGPAAASVGEILKAHGRARDLVRRILLFSRRQDSSRQAVAVAPIVEEAMQLLRATVPPKVAIRVNAAPSLPPVLADPVQIHQVLLNLGTNAAYAMRERGGTLTVSLDVAPDDAGGTGPYPELDPGRYLRLRVTDTGSGMSEEVRERLFEPFFTTKGLEGTGLGLSVVHGIVRDHGGSIAVTSEEGAGTTFEILLPAREAEAGSTEEGREGPARGAGQSVLYVDDEEAICRVMTRTLVRLGYRCRGFTDPAAALHEFRGSPHGFHAVVTDLQMPTMSGLDLVRAVRAVRPDTPVAVASGYPPEDIATDPDARSVAWLSKPATLDEIAGVMDRLVGGAAAEP
jgi:signal transduction histidine kinase/ActR/RegA family two-component response regulator